jgi:hypothetical protein
LAASNHWKLLSFISWNLMLQSIDSVCTPLPLLCPGGSSDLKKGERAPVWFSSDYIAHSPRIWVTVHSSAHDIFQSEAQKRPRHPEQGKGQKSGRIITSSFWVPYFF